MTAETHSLGGLLRAWRERLLPSDVGLASHGQRRTKGLRREELAQLAGMSADYVTRLEQGRWSTPSAQIVASLACALQLDRTETELLYRAAGLAPPGPGTISQHIPPGVQRMLTRTSDLPLAVFAADWTLLTSTPLWDSLFVRPPVSEVPEQNLVVDMFVHRTSMTVAFPHGGAAAFERAIVADLRRTASYAGDAPTFAALVANVRDRSPRFAQRWAEGSAAAHQSLVQTVHHPTVGDVTIDCDTLTVPDARPAHHRLHRPGRQHRRRKARAAASRCPAKLRSGGTQQLVLRERQLALPMPVGTPVIGVPPNPFAPSELLPPSMCDTRPCRTLVRRIRAGTRRRRARSTTACSNSPA